MSADTITPLHYIDDTPLWKAFILYTMFVFDSVLDPEKLKDGLEELAKHDGWKKFANTPLYCRNGGTRLAATEIEGSELDFSAEELSEEAISEEDFTEEFPGDLTEKDVAGTN